MKAPSRKTSILLSWIVVVVVCVFIFCMSAKTEFDLDDHSGIISLVKAWLARMAQLLVGHPVDISPIGHFAEFFLLGLSLANALRWHLPRRLAAKATYALGGLYAILDEFHQVFVPTRTADPVDCLVDIIGVVVGTLVFFLMLCPDRSN